MRCPICQDQAVQISGFQPGPGLDPYMQKWTCRAFGCQAEFYVVPKGIAEKEADNVGFPCLTPVS